MTKIKDKRIFGLPTWLLAFGLLIGIVLGSIDRLTSFRDSDDSRLDAESKSSSPIDQGNLSRDQSTGESASVNVKTESTPIAQGIQIRVAEGLIFEPARMSGVFIGYRAITNNFDPRFSTGDIVTEVNGVGVEDSAAGGELFIAALSDPHAKLTLHDSEHNEKSHGIDK